MVLFNMGTNLKTFFCTSVLLFFGFGVVLNGEIVQENSCSVNVTEGLIVSMKESKMEADASVFESLNVTSNAQCLQSCCMEDMCSIYMFLKDSSYKKKLNANCFLVNCNPVEKCKYRPLTGCEVGLKIVTPPTTSPLVQGQVPSTIPSATTIPITAEMTHSQASKPSMALTTVPTISPGLNNTLPVIRQNEAETQVSTVTLSHENTAIELNSVVPSLSVDQSKPLISSSSTQESNTPMTQPQPSEASTKDSFPVVGSNNIHNFDPNHGHTNTASLVIALIFGIVFLAASVVLLGRRWWESFKRRRAFSKVDYLLNGV